MHDDDEPAHNPGSAAAPSKAALKQRKKRAAKKARKEEEDGEVNKETKTVTSSVQITLTGDADKDNKIKNIKKVWRNKRVVSTSVCSALGRNNRL